MTFALTSRMRKIPYTPSVQVENHSRGGVSVATATGFECADRERAILRGTGSREPLGILNTPGLLAYSIEYAADVPRELVKKMTPHSSVVAHPSLRYQLQNFPVLYSKHCEGSRGEPRVIVGDLSTCVWAESGGMFLFSAFNTDLVVLGGWA